MSDLKDRILEELEFTNLVGHALARRLKVSITELKPHLNALEEAGKVKESESGHGKVWSLT